MGGKRSRFLPFLMFYQFPNKNSDTILPFLSSASSQMLLRYSCVVVVFVWARACDISLSLMPSMWAVLAQMWRLMW